MERVLVQRLRHLDAAARLELAREVVEDLGSSFQGPICALLAEKLDSVDGPLLEEWGKNLPETPNGAWLQTKFLGDPALAADAWARFFSYHSERDPLDLLAWARTLAAAGKQEEAAHKLRLALTQDVPHTFFARADTLVRQTAAAASTNLRQCKIAILGSSTTNLLMPVLRALCLRDRIGAELYEAPYGSIEPEVWDPQSGLAQFRPDIVLLAMHWRDLQLPGILEDEQAWVNQFVESRQSIWKQLSSSFGCHVVQPAFDYPAAEPYGQLANVVPGGRTRMIDLLNLRLREVAPTHVSILDLPAVQRRVGARQWEEEMAWVRYRQHPAMTALPELGEAYMAHVRGTLGLSRKVLVTDLDNTLWKGVIGEDGLEGIRLGPGSPEGEAHHQLQQYLLDLKQRGILLAVCSKNNLEDAQLPFQQHPHTVLKLEDFAAFQANWNDKASNIRQIAQDLSLGLDSFVFLDDNPLEREWVRSQIPEITIVELSSPFHYKRELDRGSYFEVLTLSKEDLARADQYRVEAQRKQMKHSSASLDEFLQNLQLEASVEDVNDHNLARVTQLTNKTNQFNLTTRRYTEAQVREMADDPQGWMGVFQLSDRMGSYGIIGVLACRPVTDQEATWEIDTWLMSCRTLGRQMEKFMLDRVVEAAAERGIQRIVGLYLPTAKNQLVKELYDQLEFRRISETSGETRYELDVPSEPVLQATHIRNVSKSTTRV